MDRNAVRALLEAVRAGAVNPDHALERLAAEPVGELGYASVDYHRALRVGVPEVIYGAGKTAAQIAGILGALRGRGQSGFATRVEADKAAEASALLGEGDHVYHAEARILETRLTARAAGVGRIGVVCAGTSDLPVAEEAAVVAEILGNHVERISDVGVAGIHRLFDRLTLLRSCHALVVVAGMEGALPGVVTGLVDIPVIGVPTSVGYGAAFGGLSALLTMINSCASGLSVVNIDNGFGAAFQASRINHLAVHGPRR